MPATKFPPAPTMQTNNDVLPSEVDLLCAGDRPAQPIDWPWRDRAPVDGLGGADHDVILYGWQK